MDILIPLLLLFIMYVIPELLKRRKQPKEYKYPDIPAKVPQTAEMKPKHIESKKKPQFVSDELPKSAAIHQKPAVSMPVQVVVPHSVEAESPWQGKLSPQIVQNGLIFAEILQPPRAYRPIWRSRK